MLVGADGRQSFVRKYYDIPVREWSYEQVAHIFTMEHAEPHNNIAVEHFRTEGPFAILPMQDDEKGKHRSSIVWTNHTGNALDSYDDETFNVALNARCPEFYGDVKIASPRYKFPLGLVHATRYTDQRMALIADAAHGIHPIAGQGLNIGLRDVAELTDLLAVSNNNDEDLGSADLLDLYEKRRKPDNVRMIMATDSLNKLFSRRSKSIGAIRKTGLRAVAKLPIAKKFFMTQAMGLKNEKDTAS